MRNFSSKIIKYLHVLLMIDNSVYEPRNESNESSGSLRDG